MPREAPDGLSQEELDALIASALDSKGTGDMSAFGRIVECYHLPLRLYAVRLGLRGQSVDDLTQEAFVQAFESLGRFRQGGPFLAWLKGIVSNLHKKDLERRRREKKARAGVLAQYLLERAPGTEPHGSGFSSRLGALRACVEKLTEKGRRLVQLRFAEGLSLAQIAAAGGGGSQGSVSKALFRIRTRLADCVRLALKETG